MPFVSTPLQRQAVVRLDLRPYNPQSLKPGFPPAGQSPGTTRSAYFYFAPAEVKFDTVNKWFTQPFFDGEDPNTGGQARFVFYTPLGNRIEQAAIAGSTLDKKKENLAKNYACKAVTTVLPSGHREFKIECTPVGDTSEATDRAVQVSHAQWA